MTFLGNCVLIRVSDPDAANHHNRVFSLPFRASEIHARVHLLAHVQVKMRTKILRFFKLNEYSEGRQAMKATGGQETTTTANILAKARSRLLQSSFDP